MIYEKTFFLYEMNRQTHQPLYFGKTHDQDEAEAWEASNTFRYYYMRVRAINEIAKECLAQSKRLD